MGWEERLNVGKEQKDGAAKCPRGTPGRKRGKTIAERRMKISKGGKDKRSSANFSALGWTDQVISWRAINSQHSFTD
ncbi:hypothetical protein AMECASPLE_028676 [Ameca splendens]|uniref:Uncharacterized protein n=1 Tax=Ameca splendens TaxID=208324 RepID=A0ABV0Y5J4_9TELE